MNARVAAAPALTCVALLLGATPDTGASPATAPLDQNHVPAGGLASSAANVPDVLLYSVNSSTHPGDFGALGGVAAGPDGSAYAMDTTNDRVIRLGPDGGLLAAWGRTGRRQGEFTFATGSWDYNSATGIDVAPDGSVYVADPGNHRIQRFASDGSFVSSWGSQGSSAGAFDTPIDVAVCPNGEVVVQDAGNRRLQRFSADGRFLDSWPLTENCGVNPSVPLGLAADPDGSVLLGVYSVTDSGLRVAGACVQRYSASGNLVATWRLADDTEPGPWVYPRDLVVGSDGYVYVLVGDREIQRYDRRGTFIDTFASVAARGIAVAPDGTIFGGADGRLERIDPTGESLDPFVAEDASPIGTFVAPSSVAVGADGFVYVTDSELNRIQRFGGFGVYSGQWGKTGEGPGQFDGPMGIAVGPNGAVYVADTGNNRVQLFSPRGVFDRQWGGPGTGPGQFDRPTGIGVGGDGRVYVVDSGNNRVQQFDADGTYLREMGGTGTGEGELAGPVDVAVDRDGTVYVSDSGHYRIAAYGITGEFHQSIGFYGGGDGQFQAPAGIAASPTAGAAAGDAHLFAVEEKGNLLQRFTSSGSPLMAWGGQGANRGLLTDPVDVAIGPDGRVYVAERANQRVQVFSSSGEFLDLLGHRSLSSAEREAPELLGEGQLRAVDIDTAPDGSFAVANDDGRIARFESTGSFIGQWGLQGTNYEVGDLWGIEALSVAPDGTVYILSDYAVLAFALEGTHLRTWQISLSTLPPGNVDPSDIATGLDGSVYVVSRDLARLLRFDPRGALLGEWMRWLGRGPDIVAVGTSSDIYTAGNREFVVDHLTASGDRLGEWGSRGSGPGQFGGNCGYSRYGCGISDVATDALGRVYVGDPGNDRIQLFSSDGEYIDAIALASGPLTSLNTGGRFDVDRSGPSPRLLVLDGPEEVDVFGVEAPDSWRAEYYGNQSLAERALRVDSVAHLDLAWDDSEPALDMPTDGLSARFQRYLTVAPGLYELELAAQGGCRLWTGDWLLVDRWNEETVAATATAVFGPGPHDLLVEYRTSEPGGSISLEWVRIGDLRTVYLPSTAKE